MFTLAVMDKPVDQTWPIEEVAKLYPPTWEEVFENATNEIRDISQILNEQEINYGPYFPLKKDIFNAFYYTQLSKVKVVILGQDPYHQSIFVDGKNLPRSAGMSFSVRKEDSIPSSLQNIYTELSNSVFGFNRPNHGDLTHWAVQGVLMLNACLTVKPGKPGSHGDIWLGFINRVFKAIAMSNPRCIYLLWGKEVQKLRPMLGDKSIVLEAAHPSGLSANRGFYGCNHFVLVNEYLVKQGKTGINWSEAPEEPKATGTTKKFASVNTARLPTLINRK